MARLGCGLGLENGEPPAVSELAEITALGVLDYLVYVDQWTSGAWFGACRWLRERQPSARFHLRIEARGYPNAAADVETFKREWARWRELAATIRIRNEGNLEGGGCTANGWAQYLITLANKLPTDILTRTYAPAISPGTPDWLEWLDATTGAANWYAGLDCHAYGTPAQIAGVIADHRQRWRGRLIVTESNPGAGQVFSHEQWAADLPTILRAAEAQRVEAFCLFIWRWNVPDVYLPTPVDIYHSPVREAIRDANAAALADAPAVEEDTPMSLAIAILPSNQANNLVLGGPLSERDQCERFAKQLLAACARRGIVATWYSSPPETDSLTFPQLRAQQQRARTWLESQPPGARLLALNIHTDSGVQSHVGWYHDGKGESQRLGRSLGDVLGRCFGTSKVLSGNYSEYIFARTMRESGKDITALLLEVGSHENAANVERLATGGDAIAEYIVSAIADHYGIPSSAPTDPINWTEIKRYAAWSLLRIDAREDPRSLAEFTEHIRATGGDGNNPRRYGYPG